MATTTEAGLDAGSPLKDFPEFLGAMVVKELRQGVRGKMFIVPFIAIHAGMLFALSVDLAAVLSPSTPGFTVGSLFHYGVFGGMPGQGAFWQVALLFMLVVMPWAGLSALSREREGRNGELLLMAGVSRWKIVAGKWLTLCALGTLTAITMLPYLLVRYFVGGMDVPATIGTALVAVSLNATANAMAIGLSGYASLGTRMFVGVLGAVAFVISSVIVASSSAFLAGMILGENSLAAWVGAVVGLGATGFLYCSMGLQLGRLRMKPFERPYEEATSGGLCSLIILCPILLGVIAVLTFGTAAIVGAILLGFTVIKMDPTPKQRRAFRGTYPPSRVNPSTL